METTIETEKDGTLNNGAILSSVPFHYFSESLILQIGDFLYFAGKNIFWDWSNWFLQVGIYLLTTAFNHSFIN